MARDAVGTLPGRAIILLVLVSVPGLSQLLLGSTPLSALGLDPLSRLGAVVLAGLVASICFVVMVTVMLIRTLLRRREEEPMNAHPQALPDLAAVSVMETILGASVFVWCFFYLFYWTDLALQMERRWLALSLHVGLTQLQSVSVGLLVAVALRQLLRGSGGLARAERIHRASVVPFLLSFSLIALLPQVLRRAEPAFLFEVAQTAPKLMYCLQAPLAIIQAVANKEGGAALAGGSALLAFAVITGLGFLRWRHWAPLEIAEASTASRCGPLLRPLPFPTKGPTFWRQAGAFWSKEVLGCEPRGHPLKLGRHAILLVGAIVALLLVPATTSFGGFGVERAQSVRAVPSS